MEATEQEMDELADGEALDDEEGSGPGFDA